MDFNITRGIGLELGFDAARVSPSCLIDRFPPNMTVHARTAPLSRDNSIWCLRAKDRRLVVCSPTIAPGATTLDTIFSLFSRVSFRGFSDRWSTPITKRCSYHLHIDALDLSEEELLWVAQTGWLIEPAINQILPTSRTNGTIVVPLRSIYSEVPTDLTGMRTNQELGLSLFTHARRGDIEIRYSAGTHNAHKIVGWIVLWHSILNKTIVFGPPNRELRTLEQLFAWLCWNQENRTDLRDWFLNRREELLSIRRERARAILEGV